MPTDDTLKATASAEAALCGCAILSPDVVVRVGKLEPSDFGTVQYREIWSAIGALFDRGTPVDTLTLEAELATRGTLAAVGGIAGLSQLLLAVPTATNAKHYADIIRSGSYARQLALGTSGVITRLQSGADWRGEVSNLRALLDDIEAASEPVSPGLGDLMTSELATIRAGTDGEVGLPTGLGIERVCPTGIPLDKITTVCAETGHLKTTLVANMAWNMARAGHTVVNISWEDSNELGAQRAIGRAVGVGYGKLAARKLDAHDRMVLALGADDVEVGNRVIMVEDCEPTVQTVIRLARFYKRTRGARAVFVDYIQLLTGKGTQKEVLDDAIQQLQRSAKVDRIAYVIVSQVKAEVTNRAAAYGGPRPTLDDCLGSSSIRIGSKLGLCLYRPYRYSKLLEGKDDPYNAIAARWHSGKVDFLQRIYPNIIEINISKNVIGEAPARVHAIVDLPTGRITAVEL